MITVKEAQNRIISNKISLNIEIIKVKDSLGRVTSKNIKSKIFNPPNDVSAMDGYAVKFKDAIRINSTPVSIVGESSAGNPYKKSVRITSLESSLTLETRLAWGPGGSYRADLTVCRG